MDADLNETHDPALESWVDAANDPAGDFPLQNLPLGTFCTAQDRRPRPGVAIGDQVLDLWAAGLMPGRSLIEWMASDAPARRGLRLTLSRRLRRGAPDEASTRAALWPMDAVSLSLPCPIGDYTDFYIGIHHARAVGAILRPDQPLSPNYRWMPIAYHGRASSVQISAEAVVRPQGQILPTGATVPVLSPTRRLDFELELGALIGMGNTAGVSIPLDQAETHIAGLVLLNDWSARDIQSWEYQPLGPFLGKNFATTVSAWVVTLEALLPFRCPMLRPAGDTGTLAYLDDARNRQAGAFDIELSATLQTARMRAQGYDGDLVACAHFARAAHWTLAQMVTHHTVNGCPLRTGDLLGTGTLSVPQPGGAGSLLERSLGGREALRLSDGEYRTYLEDGDTVTLRARASRQGMRSIGFGACVGTISPARTPGTTRPLSVGGHSP